MNTETEIQKVAFPDDHYKWLDIVAKEAAERLGLKFNPNDYSAAHGDKCYGFKFKWKKAGIPFERGVFIYLMASELPYSAMVRQTRHNGWVDPGQWVIEAYQDQDTSARMFGKPLQQIFDDLEEKHFLRRK